ncbi:MAG: helix-hairpin-helix domain-containing protein [Rhodocyclaceae bacterium]|nr:helix-hairpin-helix domain-containing protein [Rhodocyclaceae bacterium]
MLTFLRPLVLASLLALAPLGALASEPVDINKASAVELETVNGIGPAKAAAIVDFRESNGPFASVDELEKVPGIGPKSMEKLRPQITASGAESQ